MSIVACISCDASFEYSYPGRGRKRRKCFSCAPHRVRTTPKGYERRGEVRGVCPVCSTGFSGRAGRIYCGEACRDWNRGVDCSGCGERCHRSRTNTGKHFCYECRRAGRAERSHGVSGYRHGCRCGVCRAAQAERFRRYAKAAKSKRDPLHRRKKTVEKVCEQCGDSFAARVDQIKRGGGKFCSIKCGNTFKSHSQQRYIDGSEKREALQSRWREFGKQGSVRWRALRRARAALELSGGKRVFVNGPCLVCKEEFTAAGVSARYCSRECRELNLPDKFGASWLDRMWLYARDEWMCHLCGLDVAYGVDVDDPRAATLDHLVPQAAGGSHDFENLRTCHSLCNSIRRDLPVSMFRSVEAVSMLRSRLLEALGVAA